MGKASRHKRERLKCDFCNAPNPTWAYRTYLDPTENQGSGGWAACDICHDLIERGQHNSLAKRSVDSMMQRHPELAQVAYRDVIALFRGFHDDFRAHRATGTEYFAMTSKEYEARYGQSLGVQVDRFMIEEGLDILMGKRDRPGDVIGRPTPGGQSILHKVWDDEYKRASFIPEGFTPEQLSDPRTVEYLMQTIERDRPTPNLPLTLPAVHTIKEWVGARTYLQACTAIYGECPRPDDIFDPRPAMMLAQRILEPILGAHPLVLEPEQMNAIEDKDWSFAEAIEYAKMAHLPFEPVYIDFGGFEPVMVDLMAGPCRLHGAVIWRSGFFKTPTLAVAPIGGFDYLTGPFFETLLESGMDKKDIIRYAGQRPGIDVIEGEPETPGTISEIRDFKEGGYLPSPASKRHFKQWEFQPAGICWFGVETPDVEAFATMGMKIQQQRGETEVPMVFSTGLAIARTLQEERLLEDPRSTQAQVLTGLYDDPDVDQQSGQWAQMAQMATEMVARLAERALLGLYFIENAPVAVEEVSLSRPERREMERKRKKGRDPGKTASIVVISGRRSDSSRSESPAQVEHEYRWERRGYFMHIHANNRHYQNRPDLVKPCPKCSIEYAENERARREGQDLPHPYCESPDCVKIWVAPTVCGPEGKPLKKKVRIRRQDKAA